MPRGNLTEAFSNKTVSLTPRIGIRPPRLASAPSARAREPQRQQEHDRSDRGVDDEANYAGAEVNSEALQKPVADEGANDANRGVADETEPVAPYNLACQPSGDEPDDQMTINPWSDRCMLSPSALRFDSA